MCPAPVRATGRQLEPVQDSPRFEDPLKRCSCSALWVRIRILPVSHKNRKGGSECRVCGKLVPDSTSTGGVSQPEAGPEGVWKFTGRLAVSRTWGEESFGRGMISAPYFAQSTPRSPDDAYTELPSRATWDKRHDPTFSPRGVGGWKDLRWPRAGSTHGRCFPPSTLAAYNTSHNSFDTRKNNLARVS